MLRWETKDYTSEIKELDEKKGYVEAYANVYNNVDYAGDISHPSSFVKTVSENFKKLRVYRNHDTDIIVGVPKLLDPHDPFGLKTGTQFTMDVGHPGRNMFLDVKYMLDNGQDADLSIGYKVLNRDKKDARIVKEYHLHEYSFLTSWGCNPLAVATGAKSAEGLIESLTKMYNLPYNDDRLIQLEKILKSLTTEPEAVVPTTPVDEPSVKDIVQTIKKGFKNGN